MIEVLNFVLYTYKDGVLSVNGEALFWICLFIFWLCLMLKD